MSGARPSHQTVADNKEIKTTANLLNVSADVRKEILDRYLDRQSLVSLSRSCHRLYSLYQPGLTKQNLKRLLTAIVSGQPDSVEKIIKEYPRLLLEKLEAKEFVIAPSGQRANAKPYQMALAVEDTQMAEMIQAALIKVAGAKEADAQYQEQFPEGWAAAEEKRWAPIFTQLMTLTHAIRDAKLGDITSSGAPNLSVNGERGISYT